MTAPAETAPDLGSSPEIVIDSPGQATVTPIRPDILLPGTAETDTQQLQRPGDGLLELVGHDPYRYQYALAYYRTMTTRSPGTKGSTSLRLEFWEDRDRSAHSLYKRAGSQAVAEVGRLTKQLVIEEARIRQRRIIDDNNAFIAGLLETCR